ncbi:hypothetical protein [Nitrosomonas supralitoralis]|uniref:Uncharacterized protein n=1 Tax=Nitrosomonas supralitoralis TaxID=2116706 RepID=A0A2P7NXZ2_9PROT|nr:hypothetical protein [Nitrosomonas supralitoralis]PSJ18335.1 hypothetical protein C7H79_02895 [Nitrosomonas supralitoralis]
MAEKDGLQESIRILTKEWPSEDTDFFNVKITAIESYIPPGSQHKDAIKTMESAKLARKYGYSDKGLMYILEAESARKDFLLYDAAVKGGLFTRPLQRGIDRLSKILLEILKQLGKEVSSKDVLKELRRIAEDRLPNAVILEVDDDNSVCWKSKKGITDTPFRHLENRLSKLRKKI